ncbi:hypothetical protein B9Z55_000732 [Caenorhabditis nigoni]|uniref:Uncharacterized protein n=1 Tax=Caenorhabditis nigoni TaxID=1611254 RepID=A0A2G5VV72_9PELO|nr:hypothetical protein B9Z55_000732 [Caenorhabditis nigoni]
MRKKISLNISLKRWTSNTPIKTLKIGQVLKTGEQNENITKRLLWFRLIVQQHKKRISIISRTFLYV